MLPKNVGGWRISSAAQLYIQKSKTSLNIIFQKRQQVITWSSASLNDCAEVETWDIDFIFPAITFLQTSPVSPLCHL